MFYEKAGDLHQLPVPEADERDVERLAMALTRPLGTDPSGETPLCDARLVDGSRVALCVRPATDAPAVTIRRFSKVALTPGELVASGSLPQRVLDLMGQALAGGGNLMVAGGTGSGKTTLLNALIQMFPANHRLVVIEDTIELRVDQLNTVRLEARKLSKFDLTIRDMVKHALRQRPDHIVVGEIRGAEAQDVLQALNTGHGGSLTTIHANTAEDALTRLASCAMQAEDRLPWDVLCQQVASAFSLVAHQARRADRSRGIQQLIRVKGTMPRRLPGVPRFSGTIRPRLQLLSPASFRLAPFAWSMARRWLCRRARSRRPRFPWMRRIRRRWRGRRGAAIRRRRSWPCGRGAISSSIPRRRRLLLTSGPRCSLGTLTACRCGSLLPARSTVSFFALQEFALHD